MTDALRHALVIVSFLLVGVPSNVAVLWIHTRKNSRVAKNKFPLMFAAIDLFALIAVLPVQQSSFEMTTQASFYRMFFNAFKTFVINGYLLALFLATIDKFYAVMFPFKYRKRRVTIFRTAIFITLVPNTVLIFILATIGDNLGLQAFLIMHLIYGVIILMMFLTICIFYVIIIAKLFHNHQNLTKVKDNG